MDLVSSCTLIASMNEPRYQDGRGPPGGPGLMGQGPRQGPGGHGMMMMQHHGEQGGGRGGIPMDQGGPMDQGNVVFSQCLLGCNNKSCVLKQFPKFSL